MKNNDVALIRRILTGDEQAFAELVEKYQKPVNTLAWRKIGDFHIAEEITQDTFLKAYQKLNTLKDHNQFSGWLYVIATNLCATWLRKNRIQTERLQDAEIKMTPTDAYSQHVSENHAKTAIETQREVVKKLLAKLKESERTVMTLHYIGEMKIEEISRFLGVSASTIKSRLRRARLRLQKEETMIREALEHFQISPNLTDNIMQEIARLKPAPSGSKPLVPWAIAASSVVLIVLMLGIGNQYLAHFQKPYSLDAQVETTLELFDAPIVLNLDTKPDIRRQLGSTNAPGKSNNNGPKPDEVLLAAAQADGKDVPVTKQQWIQAEAISGSSVGSFLTTSDGDLYTVIPRSGKIYKLPANEETWQDIIDIWTLDHSGIAKFILSKWNNTLYYTQSSDLFTSTDDGKTWNKLYSWDNNKYYNCIELILLEQAFYMAFQNDVFRSEDTGKTWKKISNGLTGRIESLVEIQNTLLAGTYDGFFRLEVDSWKRLEFPEPIDSVASVAATEKMLYVLASLNRAALDPAKVSRGHERGWGVFRSSNLGDSWHDITPINAWAINGFIPEAKLIAFGDTLLLMERGMVRSTDGGITWSPPQLAGTSPQMYSRSPAVVLNTDTIYVGSDHGLHRSTDGGKSWDIVNIMPDESGIDNIIALKETDREQNMLPTLYARLGMSIVKTTDNGKSWMNVPVEIPMTKPLRETSPSINQIVNSGVIYASVDYQENGKKVRLYRVSADGRAFVPIQGAPFFDSGELKRQLPRNLFVEILQEKYSGAVQFFKHLVQGDNRKQNELIKLGLHGAFAVSGDTFYMEYNYKLFRWKQGDTEWYDTDLEETTELALDVARKDLKLAASGNTLYVGKRDGHLVASFDKGNNWLDLTPALPFSVKAFKEIVFVGSTVYVTTDAGVAAADNGKNWSAITDAAGTNLIMEHLAADGTMLYGVTKNTGIYSLETGTWQNVVSDIPDNVSSLAVDGYTLYVGTENRGMLHYNLDK